MKNDMDKDRKSEVDLRDSREVYDAQAESFASQAPTLLTFEYLGRPTIRKFLAEYLPVNREKAKVLDVGSASGRIVELIIESGCAPKNITGVEISPKEVAIARARLPEVNFTVGDIREAELPGGIFDIATSYMVFEFLDDKGLLKAFKKIYRSLRPGGIFIYGTTHPARWTGKYGVTEEGWFSTGGPWGSSYDSAGQWVSHDKFDNWFRPTARFIETTEKAGFNIEKVEELEMPPEVVRQHPEHKTFNAPERLFVVAHKP